MPQYLKDTMMHWENTLADDFLDTSAIYALADSRDANHGEASNLFNRAIETDESLMLHNYILVESAALIQNRLGLDSALRFLHEVNYFQLYWITPSDHSDAEDLLESRGRRQLSLVDCMSFVVMRKHQVQHALAFDADFEMEGFRVYS